MYESAKRSKVTVTDRHRNNVLDLYKGKFDYKKISEIVGIGESTVRYIIRAYECVKTENFDEIKSTSSLLKNESQLRWACAVNNVDADNFIERLINGVPKEDDEPEEKGKEKEKATANDIEDAIHVATKLMTVEIQKTMQEQAEVLAKKLDQIATIVQSCCKNQMDKNNANADIAMKEYQKMNESLSWIRSQTKNLRYVK